MTSSGFPSSTITLDGGDIVEEGKPEDVIDNPKSERTKAFLQKMA